MIVPDVNLLLYAYDTTSPFHVDARRWLETLLSGRELVGLTRPVVFGFVRIATSPRVYRKPMTLAAAAGHVKSWLGRPVSRMLEPDADHVDRVMELLAAAGSSGGNLVGDAQIASLALTHRAVIHTADRDFLRFPKVKVRYPLD